jgi:hypothetical protein
MYLIYLHIFFRETVGFPQSPFGRSRLSGFAALDPATLPLNRKPPSNHLQTNLANYLNIRVNIIKGGVVGVRALRTTYGGSRLQASLADRRAQPLGFWASPIAGALREP